MKKEIRLVHQFKLTNPFDPKQSTCIAGCEDRWQAYDPYPIATYFELYGQDLPDKLDPLSGENCELRIVDGRSGELYSIPGKAEIYKTTYQGNALDCAPDCTDAIKIELVENWDSVPTTPGFKSTSTHSVTKLNSDGSARISVPCGKPFLMKGLKADGTVSATDNHPMSLPKGEKRTCHGCHDAHSESKAASFALTPAQRFSRTEAGTFAVNSEFPN